MASSSTGSEGANEIPEDLVLSWTRDATINTFGTLVENDRRLVKELIQCVHTGNDVNATKQKLSVLLGTGKDRKSVVIRARVLTRLIAIALGLHPDDITVDSKTRKESCRPSADFLTALRLRFVEALQDDNGVLSYLFKDALEADDEVMTVIFCDRCFFKKYPVPYFHGCDLGAVDEISSLWLSQEIWRRIYYSTVLEPLFNHLKAGQLMRRRTHPLAPVTVVEAPGNHLKAAQLPGRRSLPKILEENLLKATMMLCELLQRRTVKAGARLLEVILSFRNDKADNVINGLVIPLAGFKNGKFRKCIFGDFENQDRGARWHLRDSDQVLGRHGQFITIGPSSAQTDSNLLCWAARRGYSNLIWCITQGYTEACQMPSNENLLHGAAEAQTVSLLWKVALWCATRHGQDSAVMELTSPKWVKNIDFNDYTGIQGCLSPLHLVSLLGDRSLLRILRMSNVNIESGAYKTDYLGKTPLDYAMQFQLITENSKEGMHFHVFTNDIKDRMQFEAPNNDFKEQQLQSRPIERDSYYTTGMQPSYIYNRAMPMPTSRYRSCIRELLQMPGVVDRLKELNDMYTTQANFVLVGAALIASVAFGGWLQPPLGYADYFQFTQPSPPAPTDTYEQYVAVEGHLSVQMFVVFNALSFFLGIGTMLIGAEATLFVHDNDERTIALMKVQKSIKWMLGFFITSMVCIMVAFICAGLAILPPIQRLEWSMIVSLCLGACICLIPLTWILFSLAKDQIVKLKDQMVKFILQFGKEEQLDEFVKDLHGPLVNEEDIKTLQDEKERKCREQSSVESMYGPLAEPYMENQTPDSYSPIFYEWPHSNQRPDSLERYDDYDYEFRPSKSGRFGKSVSYEKPERPAHPPKIEITKPTPTIQRHHSWA